MFPRSRIQRGFKNPSDCLCLWMSEVCWMVSFPVERCWETLERATCLWKIWICFFYSQDLPRFFKILIFWLSASSFVDIVRFLTIERPQRFQDSSCGITTMNFVVSLVQILLAAVVRLSTVKVSLWLYILVLSLIIRQVCSPLHVSWKLNTFLSSFISDLVIPCLLFKCCAKKTKCSHP